MGGALALRNAVRVLCAGGVIAYPTEAVWGLGCEPRNRHAVARLLAIKQRDWRKGLILIAAHFEQLQPFIARLGNARLKSALSSWPGPTTWLLPAADDAPGWITGGSGKIAVRVTAHPLAATLCRGYGGAIVSTSANISSRPPARNRMQVQRRFNGAVDFILAGALGGLDRPTSIRELGSGRTLRK